MAKFIESECGDQGRSVQYMQNVFIFVLYIMYDKTAFKESLA